MKKILVTGANSYIGVSFEKFLKSRDDLYLVDTVDMIDGTWREKDFSQYDVVFHVAGIAHKKEKEVNSELYYKINRDMAIETAEKAKKEGVRQFIFLSSMSVYGMVTGVITKDTLPKPTSNYGKSKFEAETKIAALADESFSVVTVRPPMVYGKDCKGNFVSILKIVKKSPVFPKVNNKRSMIYIDNLISFVKMCIDRNLSGLYFPQNKEYINTSEMAKTVAEKMGKKLYISSFLGFLVKLCSPFAGIFRKAFGTLVYSDTEDFGFEYCVAKTKESILKSV